MAYQWDVLSQAERTRWEFDPLGGIGPVRFDMTCEQIADVVADVFPRCSTRRIRDYRQEVTRAIFSPSDRR